MDARLKWHVAARRLTTAHGGKGGWELERDGEEQEIEERRWLRPGRNGRDWEEGTEG